MRTPQTATAWRAAYLAEAAAHIRTKDILRALGTELDQMRTDLEACHDLGAVDTDALKRRLAQLQQAFLDHVQGAGRWPPYPGSG